MSITATAPQRAPYRLRAALLVACLSLGAAGCGSSSPSPTIASPSATFGSPIPTSATPSPTPTPQPTPRFTNEPDAALSALIPARLGSVVVEKPAVSAYGETPGDVGLVFGDLGLRFESLAAAFVRTPRLAMYAIRVASPAVTMEDLRPHLAAAGEFLGIQGLHPEAWRAAVVAGKQVWTRGDDPATVVGTTLYCWTTGEYVFLLIGANDRQNRLMVAALPGEPVTASHPSASATASGSGSAAPSGSPSG
jgi:hypothetical protein